MKRRVDYNPMTGITTSVDYNSVTDTTAVIHEFDDLSAVLDQNKALANDTEYTKKGIKNGFWHYAFLPNAIIHKWMIEDGINVYRKEDEKKVFQKLNSPEYRYLKTTAKYHEPRPS